MTKRSKRSNKPLPAPVIKPGGDAEQTRFSSFQHYFTTAAVVALVSGLITLATVCSVYLFNAGKYMRDVQLPVQQAMADDRDQINSSEQFSHRAEDVVARNHAVVMKYFSGHPWYKQQYFADQKARNEALAAAALAIQQANTDLGSLSAYSEDASLVPNVYKTAAFDMLRSDIAVWNALTALAEATTASNEQKSFDVLGNRWSELSGALSSFENSRAALVNSLKKKGVEEKRVYENQVVDFQATMRKQSLAAVGLGVSVTGLLVILGFILWPTPKRQSGVG
jgi:hypothetical protein